MEATAISALAGVVGAAVGGFISYFSMRSLRRMEIQLAMTEKEILKRESLYSEFLSEANRLMLTAVGTGIASATEFASLMALDARIRLNSDSVAETSMAVVNCVLDHSSKPKRSVDARFPALRDQFIARCKSDLAALRSETGQAR